MSTNQDEPSVSSSGSCAQAESEVATAPWDATDITIDDDANYGGQYEAAVWDNIGDLVCAVTTQMAGDGTLEPAIQRARLIAVAPDLLEAAKIGLRFVRKWKRYEEENEPRMDGSAWPETINAKETLEGVIAKAEGEA